MRTGINRRDREAAACTEGRGKKASWIASLLGVASLTAAFVAFSSEPQQAPKGLPLSNAADQNRELAISFIAEKTSESLDWVKHTDDLVRLGLSLDDAKASLQSAIAVYAECLVDGHAVLDPDTERYLIEQFAKREEVMALLYVDVQQMLRDRGLEMTDYQIELLKKMRNECASNANQVVGAPFEIF